MRSPRTARFAVLAFAAAALLFTVLLVTAPVLQQNGSVLGWVVRATGSTFCHQDDGRSFSILGVPLAVCARCTGLYAGGVIGLLAGGLGSAWLRPAPRKTFFVLITPTLVDAVLPFIGFLGYSGLANLPRMLISLPAGAVCGWFLAIAVGEIVSGSPGVPREVE